MFGNYPTPSPGNGGYSGGGWNPGSHIHPVNVSTAINANPQPLGNVAPYYRYAEFDKELVDSPPSYEYSFYDKLELVDLRKLREVINTVIYDKERK